MKAKLYPLKNMINETSVCVSSFCLHIQIICASLANGTTTIKGVINSLDIDTTIEWCKALGASIKKNNDKLIIKGISQDLSLSQSLFTCGNTSITAKLMLPILATLTRPFGIKGNEKLLQELDQLLPFFEAYGINHYLENQMVRFECSMKNCEAEFDGDIDIYLSAGILIALSLFKGPSVFKLRAPVRCEKSYNLILKILKNFSIDIKHPATMRYEIVGNQRFRSCVCNTEIDTLYLSHLSLLSTKLSNEGKIKITNYKNSKLSNENRLFDFVCENVVLFKKYFPKNTFKRKEFQFHKIEYSVENSLPFLMVLGVINNQDTLITKIDFSNKRIKRQYKIMESIFSKLKLGYSYFNNEILIHPSKVSMKKQVDCENDPYVVMAISFLALLSDYPIVIKNADCIFDINKDFFKDITSYGAKIEFIHDN